MVHLTAVRHRMSDRFALDVPSLTLGPGVTAVLGPNGCGKSTLLRILATVIEPHEGELVVGGVMVNDAGLTSVRRRLGYLPQDDSVPRRLTAFDHVDLVAVMREIGPDPRARRGAVHRALADVFLHDLTGERCARLSGGQRRRVAVAAALVGDAPYLVLDEPDAHLDVDQRTHLAGVLRARLGATGDAATIVIATHDHSWAAEVADRTVRLDGGRVVG